MNGPDKYHPELCLPEKWSEGVAACHSEQGTPASPGGDERPWDGLLRTWFHGCGAGQAPGVFKAQRESRSWD